MSDRMPEYHASTNMSNIMSEFVSDRVPECMSNGMPVYASEYVSNQMSEYTVYLYIYTPNRNRRSVGGDHSKGSICWLYIHICYIIYACLYHSKLP